MDEFDRHIITFDDDTPDEADVEKKSDLVMTPSAPENSETESPQKAGPEFEYIQINPEDMNIPAGNASLMPDFEPSRQAPQTDASGTSQAPSAGGEAAPSSQGNAAGTYAASASPSQGNAAGTHAASASPSQESAAGSYPASAASASGGADASSSARTSPHAETIVKDGPATSSAGGGSHYAPPAKKKAKKKKEKKYVTRGALIACMAATMLISSALGAFFGAGVDDSSDSRAPRDDSSLSELDLSEATGSELTVQEIVDKNADAVVEILVSGTSQNLFGQMQPVEGAGSGVIINKNGYIVTNYHVIEGANKVQVTLHNGDIYDARVVGGDNDNDIAVIKINGEDLTVAKIGDSSKVQVGDLAVAIGNPLGQLGGTATTGIISALDRRLSIDGRTMSLMQTDAAINPGNSGGGLFSGSGDLIGIVDAKSAGTGVEGLAFAIPINNVSGIINDLVENGKVSGKPAIGIMIQDVSEENAQLYGFDTAGVYVAQVTGTNAEQAGFQQGDRIISIDGNKIKDSADFITRVREHKVGDTVTVVVSRNGQEIEIKSVLEESTATE